MTVQESSKRDTVLLADDSLPGLLTVKAMLTKLGYQVSTVANGGEALQLASQQAFDIILLDEHMPVLRGSEVVRQIRQTRGPNASTRVVALSGEASASALSNMRESGFDDCIEKPVIASQLENLMRGDTGEPASPTYSSALEQLYVDLGEESASRLLGLFVQELAQLRDRLLTARDRGDETEILAVAHILKNSAAMYGAASLAELALRINDEGARGDVSQAAPLIELCDKAAEAARTRLLPKEESDHE
ncbi:response regulator [Spongiibacter marinus]|uniref:response regulator n=1 Tax=Spongiibacter marinus TaxID=354246 RepID=UPI000411EFCF|nr:response regulator [Spongiibacter marinus]